MGWGESRVGTGGQCQDCAAEVLSLMLSPMRAPPSKPINSKSSTCRPLFYLFSFSDRKEPCECFYALRFSLDQDHSYQGSIQVHLRHFEPKFF